MRELGWWLDFKKCPAGTRKVNREKFTVDLNGDTESVDTGTASRSERAREDKLSEHRQSS